MDAYVAQHQREPGVRTILDAAAREAGVDPGDTQAILAALHRWSDDDVKITPLKELQGLIWAEGFQSSGIRGHLYPDAIDALRRFHAAGVRLYIYSSGSVGAQKLLFGHSVAGDLIPLFGGFFDTTVGGKREARSYELIASELAVAPAAAIFFSDVEAELDAARTAGIQTVQVARPQDGTVRSTAHPSIESFEEVNLVKL